MNDDPIQDDQIIEALGRLLDNCSAKMNYCRDCYCVEDCRALWAMVERIAGKRRLHPRDYVRFATQINNLKTAPRLPRAGR